MFRSRGLVEAVVLKFPGVQVVVSSTWRVQRSIGVLRELFSKEFQSRVVGRTPFRYSKLETSGEYVAFPRHWECLLWMRAHRPAWFTWVAVDDNPAIFKPNLDCLLTTDSRMGFTSADAERLRQLLSRHTGNY